MYRDKFYQTGNIFKKSRKTFESDHKECIHQLLLVSKILHAHKRLCIYYIVQNATRLYPLSTLPIINILHQTFPKIKKHFIGIESMKVNRF